MDGLTCLSRLLAVKPTVKVIVISALSDPGTGLRALKLGAKSFLPKPFTETQLVDEIRRVVGGAV
jgi:two-component system chemotaxis response regulator CheY